MKRGNTTRIPLPLPGDDDRLGRGSLVLFTRPDATPVKESTFIIQRHLCTHVEMTIDRHTAKVLASALIEHFHLTPAQIAETTLNIHKTKDDNTGH